MKLSIGILAYNKGREIPLTLESVFGQTVIGVTGEYNVEVIVVANGCTDDTESISREVGHRLASRSAHVAFRVEVISEASKTNAWNMFVHRFADPQADYLVVMDADIRIIQEDVIARLVDALKERPAAALSTPTPLKHIVREKRRSFRLRMSLAMTEISHGRGVGFAGCMYCMRGETARTIWFPRGLLGDDAVLHGMIVTENCLHQEPDHSKIVHVEKAEVEFQTYLKLREVYRCQRRLAVIRGMDAILWKYLWEHASGGRAGEVIRELNHSDPDWFIHYLRREIRSAGWWVMPRGVLWRRFRWLRRLPWAYRLRLLPWAMLALPIDTLAHIDANWRLKRGRLGGVWSATASL